MFVRAFPDRGGVWQISNGGGSDPRWSRNGHDLLYLSPDHRSILAAGYSAKGDAFTADKPRVWLGSQPQPIADYDAGPDGKRTMALLPVPGQAETEVSRVTFLINFADKLRRRTSAGKVMPVRKTLRRAKKVCL